MLAICGASDRYLAVGHAEAGPCISMRGVARRVVEVLRDEQPEQMIGVVVGGVQRIGVGAGASTRANATTCVDP